MINIFTSILSNIYILVCPSALSRTIISSLTTPAFMNLSKDFFSSMVHMFSLMSFHSSSVQSKSTVFIILLIYNLSSPLKPKLYEDRNLVLMVSESSEPRIEPHTKLVPDKYSLNERLNLSK